MRVSLIVAMDLEGVIGHQGDLPWHLRADLQRFKRLTMGHPMIMGRKTHESIGRLLPGRTTVIVTRQTEYLVPGAIVAAGIEEALSACQGSEEVFITGGAEIYRAAFHHVDRLYLTRVQACVKGDTFFDQWSPQKWDLIESEPFSADAQNDHDVFFEIWDRKSKVDRLV